MSPANLFTVTCHTRSGDSDTVLYIALTLYSIVEVYCTVLNEWLVSFRTPRRKRGIRGNRSTATVPGRTQTTSWSICSFAVVNVINNIGRDRSRVCPARPGARAANKSADWLITCSVLSLHRTLIWPSTVAYFSGTGEFSELRRPPAEISGLSFLRRACKNSLIFCCSCGSQSVVWKANFQNVTNIIRQQ